MYWTSYCVALRDKSIERIPDCGMAESKVLGALRLRDLMSIAEKIMRRSARDNRVRALGRKPGTAKRGLRDKAWVELPEAV
jgi:hypothetical protein